MIVRKVGLFFLSMWLFFVLAIVLTADIPFYIGSNWQFIGVLKLLGMNITPLLCLIGLVIGYISWFDFKSMTKGATNLPFKNIKVENQNYEHLTFLTTYIVPLVSLNLSSLRYQIVLIFLIVVICVIYVRTDLYYTNPTLALLGFKLYKVEGQFRDNEVRKNIILITKDTITADSICDYVILDERIYYAKLKKNDTTRIV